MIALVNIHQLGVDAELLAFALDTALQHVIHMKMPGDVRGRPRMVPEGERRARRNDVQSGEAGQVGDQVSGDALAEVSLSGVVAEIFEGHDGNVRFGGQRQLEAFIRSRSPVV